MNRLMLCGLALALLSACASDPQPPATPTAPQGYLAKPDYPAFAGNLAEQGFPRERLDALMATAKRQQSILDAIARPAEAKPWYQYRPIFVTDSRIDAGVDFWNAHAELLDRVAQRYGVDPAYLVAIVGVETHYGDNTGGYRVIDALATLGFDYPPRAEFFRKQLGQFFLLSQKANFDPAEVTGSYAGAMGAPQFIPTSFRDFAVDFDANGKIDLWDSWPDVLASVAHYFAVHGWQHEGLVAVPAALPEGQTPPPDSGLDQRSVADLRATGLMFSEGVPDDTKAVLIALDTKDRTDYWIGLNNFYVITRYNHSPLYAMAVYQLAESIRGRREAQAENRAE